MRCLLLFAVLLLLAAPAFGDTCPAIEGSDLLAGQRVVIFGEYHGTNEIPALFGDLACSTLQDDDRLLIALELDESLDPLLQRIFTAGEKPGVVLPEIAALDFWDTLRDGRHGRANLALIERLAGLRQIHSGLRVIALHRDAEFPVRGANRIDGLAEQLPDYRIFILTGNAHASRRGFRGYSGMPFAKRLSELQPSLLALTVRTGGGEFIACLPDGCQPVEAREFKVENGEQRQIRLFASPERWDGYFYLPELTVTEPVR